LVFRLSRSSFSLIYLAISRLRFSASSLASDGVCSAKSSFLASPWFDLLPDPGALPEPVPENDGPGEDFRSDDNEDGLDLFLSSLVSSSGLGDLSVLPDAAYGFRLGELLAESDFGTNLS
jgi:hypothetical protein